VGSLGRVRSPFRDTCTAPELLQVVLRVPVRALSVRSEAGDVAGKEERAVSGSEARRCVDGVDCRVYIPSAQCARDRFNDELKGECESKESKTDMISYHLCFFTCSYCRRSRLVDNTDTWGFELGFYSITSDCPVNSKLPISQVNNSIPVS